MNEIPTKVPPEIAKRETAIDIIGSFRSVAPLKRSHQDSYLGYLNRIQDKLETFVWRKSKKGTHNFGFNGNIIIFTPDSITWTWRHIEKGVSTIEKSVRFFLEDEEPRMELKVTPIAARTDTAISSVIIVIGNHEDVVLTKNGFTAHVPFEDAISCFPKPK